MEFFASWVFRCRVWVHLKMNYPDLEIVSRAVKRGFEAEKRIEELLKVIGVDYRKQPRGKIVLDEFSITGRADFLTENCVIEVKNSTKNFPKEWIAQLNLYMKMFGVGRGILVRFVGESAVMRAFEFDRRLYDESLEYFEWFLENRPSPPESCSKRWCSYKHLCVGRKR